MSRRRSPSSSSSASAAADVLLLLYDNHFQRNATNFKESDALYRSATALGVPFQVGSLAPATQRPWSAGDREEWLLQTLPSVKSRIVVLLDATDAILFCRGAELAAKWHRLAGSDGSGRGRVLVGVEQQLWPEEQYYIVRNKKLEYPRSELGHFTFSVHNSAPGRGTPFRYINIGMLAGPPKDVHRLLQCMQERYQGFPRQCPGVRHSNGTYEWYSNAPHRTRFGVFAGHWGWEQACFHNYLYEQRSGHLPPSCPELVLDYRAEVILNLKKTLEPLVLDWGSDANAERSRRRPHLNETWMPAMRGVHPCVLHANSASKAMLPILQLFWERTTRHELPAEGVPAPVRELDVARAVDSWHGAFVNKSMAPCVRMAERAGLLEAEAKRACDKNRPLVPPLKGMPLSRTRHT